MKRLFIFGAMAATALWAVGCGAGVGNGGIMTLN